MVQVRLRVAFLVRVTRPRGVVYCDRCGQRIQERVVEIRDARTSQVEARVDRTCFAILARQL